jgi:HPt (histidine-containing phosphotransfer) domain-containing protein
MPADAFEPMRLLQILDGDASAVKDILEDAIPSIQELVSRAAAELRAGNLLSSAHLMHELQGVAGNVGADELRSLSQRMLGNLRRSVPVQPQNAIEDLTLALKRFTVAAHAFLR